MTSDRESLVELEANQLAQNDAILALAEGVEGNFNLISETGSLSIYSGVINQLQSGYNALNGLI